MDKGSTKLGKKERERKIETEKRKNRKSENPKDKSNRDKRREKDKVPDMHPSIGERAIPSIRARELCLSRVRDHNSIVSFTNDDDHDLMIQHCIASSTASGITHGVLA